MESIQLVPLRLVDSHVHSALLVLYHLQCQFGVHRWYQGTCLNAPTGFPAPHYYGPARQPELSHPEPAQIRSTAVNWLIRRFLTLVCAVVMFVSYLIIACRPNKSPGSINIWRRHGHRRPAHHDDPAPPEHHLGKVHLHQVFNQTGWPFCMRWRPR